jgi:hypothetical protein
MEEMNMAIIFTTDQRQRLAENALMLRRSQASNPVPVVHLFHPSGCGHWLLVSMRAKEPYIAYGIADLGLGFVEYGPIDLQELADLRVQVDDAWSPKARKDSYLKDGKRHARLNIDLVEPEAA